MATITRTVSTDITFPANQRVYNFSGTFSDLIYTGQIDTETITATTGDPRFTVVVVTHDKTTGQITCSINTTTKPTTAVNLILTITWTFDAIIHTYNDGYIVFDDKIINLPSTSGKIAIHKPLYMYDFCARFTNSEDTSNIKMQAVSGSIYSTTYLNISTAPTTCEDWQWFFDSFIFPGSSNKIKATITYDQSKKYSAYYHGEYRGTWIKYLAGKIECGSYDTTGETDPNVWIDLGNKIMKISASQEIAITSAGGFINCTEVL